MADFCKQCSLELFGEDFGDLSFDTQATCALRHCLCEGCGFNCIVTPNGTCISENCLKRHGLAPVKEDDIIAQERGIAAELGAGDDSLQDSVQGSGAG